jgi:hypothetical protein
MKADELSGKPGDLGEILGASRPNECSHGPSSYPADGAPVQIPAMLKKFNTADFQTVNRRKPLATTLAS